MSAFIYYVGAVVCAVSVVCVCGLILTWLILETVDYAAKATRNTHLIVDYFVHRRKFKEWLREEESPLPFCHSVPSDVTDVVVSPRKGPPHA